MLQKLNNFIQENSSTTNKENLKQIKDAPKINKPKNARKKE